MKTVLSVALLMLAAITANAQVERNSILVGGDIYYWDNSNKVGTYEYTNREGLFGLIAGMAIQENRVIGCSFSYTPIRRAGYLYGADTLQLSYNEYVPGVFLRQYKKIGKDFYLFAQIDLRCVIRNFKESYSVQVGEVASKQAGGTLAITPGISYQVCKWLQAELSIPNMAFLHYVVMKLDYENPQVEDTRHRYLILDSRLNNSNVLGAMGIGFRFFL